MTNFSSIISSRLSISERQVAAVLDLLDEGATIPFIARYRKERTGSMDEVQIAAILDQLTRLNDLADRKATILHTIQEQGKLTPELEKQINDCWESSTLEDLYLPYKPHRKTRADVAREHGLEPLAKQLMSQSPTLKPNEAASKFLTPEVNSADDALQGARDIIAEWMNESQQARNAIRREFDYSAIITSKKVVKRTTSAKEKTEEKATSAGDSFEDSANQYRDYFDAHDRLSRIASHRLLAMRRGEAEGFLRLDISPDAEKALDKLARIFLRNSSDAAYQVELAMEDAYKRLLKPSIETEYMAKAKEKADDEAIRVFADNARQLLLAAPLGQKRILALDPGFRTGCKLVCLSAQGDLLHHSVIYPVPPKNDIAGATRELAALCNRFQIEAISIGNGTASRETEDFVRRTLSGLGLEQIEVYVVNESGASIYSAGEVARQEFPNEDVTVRGAVSIGRRLMDPLAELVKIDPKSIGVGQYQHDVDQNKLKTALTQTVESAVNSVGVDVNTASKHLLTYISGLGPTIAQNIVNYRTEHGPFTSRAALLKVPKLGPKTYQQAAGFLRVSGSKNPLDNSAVHPERYALVEQMAADNHCHVKELIHNKPLLQTLSDQLQRYVIDEASAAKMGIEAVGLPTLKDILAELEKPARDPRGQAEQFRFSDEVHTIDDLKEGMILPGKVTNITDFGAFIDLGVHQDGLLHISQIKRNNLKLTLGQTLQVAIIGVDLPRHRISLGVAK
ncbi:MAG: RNA-binding transcriptional accessory protein [Paludibacteraceae bacterium]|nr:RNA-binding transcriptional accessory protein [Paludibacteraceae bacterium]